MKNLLTLLLKVYMIKILKLSTGEELIGDVSQDSGLGVYTVKKPCLLQLIPSRSNSEQPMMALIPYASFTKQHTVNIGESFVIWTEEPVQELYNQYNSVFGSGLVVSSAL